MIAAPRLSTVHVNTERSFGGGESQTLSLARGLRDRGHGATVAAFEGAEVLARASADGIETFVLPRGALHAAELSPLTALRLAGHLRERRADVLHLHTPHAVGFGPWAARLAGTPVVVASRRIVPRRPLGAAARWKWRRPGVVVAVAEAVREALVRDGLPSDRVVVIRSGVDVTRLAALAPLDPRAEFGWGPEAQVVASVGSLLRVKGHTLLVEAARILSARSPRLRFFVAGDGPERGALEAAVDAAGLRGRFVLAGRREDAVALVRGSDLFAFPSLSSEGFPNALIEALAAGVPALATDAGGTAEVIGRAGEAGVLLPGDPAALPAGDLAAAIEALLQDEKLRERLRAAGPARAALFSAERCVDETESLYLERLRRARAERAGAFSCPG